MKRRVLVDQMQYRLIAVSLFHFALIVLVIGGALFLPLMIQLDVGDVYNEQVRVAAHEFLSLHTRVWPPLFFTVALLILHNVLVSHRIAGPLYRFRREMEEIGKGDLAKKLKIRKRDYLPKETAALNDMLASLRDKVTRIDQGCAETTAALERLERAGNVGDREQFDRALLEVKANLDLANEALAEFELGKSEDPAPAARSAKAKADQALEPVA